MLVIYIKFVVNKKGSNWQTNTNGLQIKDEYVHVLYLGMLHPLDILV